MKTLRRAARFASGSGGKVAESGSLFIFVQGLEEIWVEILGTEFVVCVLA